MEDKLIFRYTWTQIKNAQQGNGFSDNEKLLPEKLRTPVAKTPKPKKQYGVFFWEQAGNPREATAIKLFSSLKKANSWYEEQPWEFQKEHSVRYF